MEKESSQPGGTPVATRQGTRGFAFATTGKLYTDLARRAARTIRTVMPDALIDLFTDQDLVDGVFDEIHTLPNSWHRPKIYAMRCSRFERTIVLDADIVVLADISNVFEVLDKSDIAGALGTIRTQRMLPLDPRIPGCLPAINTGVLAVRASQKLREFALAWEREVRSQTALRDQPAFLKLLHLSELDFVALGPTYNCIQLDSLDVWTARMGAPRILHVRSLHEDHPGNPEEPFDLTEVLGEERAAHVANLIAADWSLGGDEERVVVTPLKRRTARISELEHKLETSAASAKGTRSGACQADQPKREDGPNPKARERMRDVKAQLRQANNFAYQAAVLAAASQREHLRICIIGANDGKFGNPIYQTVKTHLRASSDILLIEPQEDLHPFLAKNYSFHPSHQILGAAIGEGGTRRLYTIRPEHWKRFNPEYASNRPSYRAPTRETSDDREAVLSWIKEQLPDEPHPESMIMELNVPCRSLVELLQDTGRDTTIDVLQIDAKGDDDTVIYACETDVTKPSVVRFNRSSLPAPRLDRLIQYLSDQYILQELGADMMAVRRI